MEYLVWNENGNVPIWNGTFSAEREEQLVGFLWPCTLVLVSEAAIHMNSVI